MKIVNEIIEKNGGLLISLLVYREFSFDQATRFLPLMVNTAIDIMKQQEVALLLSASGAISMEALLQKIDINFLAEKIAIEPRLAESGVVVLLPRLLGLLTNHENCFSVTQGEQTLLLDARNGCTETAGGEAEFDHKLENSDEHGNR